MGREQFYTVGDVPVLDILLDPQNPRIRRAPDQRECRLKILREQTTFMNLAKDLAQYGLSIEPVVIQKNDRGKWVVKDGNRRIAALQMLNDPEVCPRPALKKEFQKLASKHSRNIPTEIDCVTSDNDDAIKRFVRLKHTGENQGVGLRRWETYLNSVNKLQEGYTDQHKRAAQLLLWAEENGIVVKDDFPITTLTRFLSKGTMATLGFEIKNDEMNPVIDESIALDRSQRVVNDLANGVESVNSLFNPDQQAEYAQKVAAACPVPGTPPRKSQSKKPVTTKKSATGRRSGRKLTWDRPKLFRSGKPGFSVPEDREKAINVIHELKNLQTAKTPLSVAVCLRILIELSTHDYRKRHRMPKEQSLAKNIRAVADKLEKDKKLSIDVNRQIKKYLTSRDHLVSIDSLHAYVHSDKAHPNRETLHTFWDEIYPYVHACWHN